MRLNKFMYYFFIYISFVRYQSGGKAISSSEVLTKESLPRYLNS